MTDRAPTASAVPSPVGPPSLVRNVPVIRGAAIALVILHHSVEFSLGIAGILALRPADWPLWQSMAELAVRALAPQCIAAFFFASGFFMYRFSKTWSAAWASARTIAFRYLLWSIPGYAVIAVVRGKLDLTAAALSLLDEGPYYGTYWFLVVLLQLSVAAPLLVRFVNWSLRGATVSCIAIQLAASAFFYSRALQGEVSESRFVLWRAPFLLAGMLVSARSDEVVRYLAARRRMVAGLAILAQLLPIAESVLWGRWRGDGSPSSWLYGLDKLTLVVAAAATLSWALTIRSEPSPARSRLSSLGMSSLAVLLASDLFFFATSRVLWHAGEWMGLPPPLAGAAPVYMRSLWVALPLFAVGLGGPILAARIVERLLGKPARRLVFG